MLIIKVFRTLQNDIFIHFHIQLFKFIIWCSSQWAVFQGLQFTHRSLLEFNPMVP